MTLTPDGRLAKVVAPGNGYGVELVEPFHKAESSFWGGSEKAKLRAVKRVEEINAWAQKKVDEALELAAKMCERRAESVIVGKAMANQCAIDIRAMKSKVALDPTVNDGKKGA
jgi:hypothetical protein